MSPALALAAAGLALLPALAGCSFGDCPAIAYIYSVEVSTTGEFATLEACVDGDCRMSEASLTSEPADSVAPFYLVGQADGRWTVGSLFASADRLTLRAYDADGGLLAEDDYVLEWTRTGGSEQCGGPMETPPVEFAV